MKNWLRWFVVLCLLLIPVALFALGNSETGLRALVSLAPHLSAGRLTIRAATGSLFDSLQLQGIQYADGVDTVIIDAVTLRWAPPKLLHQQVWIESIHTSGVRVLLGPGNQDTFHPPPFSLPVSLVLKELSVEQISIISDYEEILSFPTGTINQLSFQGQTLAVDSLFLSTAATKLQVRGQLQTSKGYPLELTWESQHHPAGYESFSGQGTLRGQLDALELAADFAAPFPFHLRGQINDLLGNPTWQARLEGKEVSLVKIHQQWTDLRFSDVVIAGKGTREDYAVHLDASTEMPPLKKVGTLTADIQGTLAGLRVDHLHFNHGKATLSGNGALDWSPALSWRAEVTGTHLDPSVVLTDWPGDFSCTLHTKGGLIGNTHEASFHLPQLQGTLRNFPLSGKGEVMLKGKQLQVPQLVITSAGSTLRISGKATEAIDLSLQLNSNNLAELWPNARGKIHAQGRLTGTPARPEIDLKFTGANLGRGRDGVGKLTIETKGTLARDGRLDATLKAEQLQLADTALSQGQLHFQGSWNDHTLTIESKDTNLAAGFQIRGKIADQVWQGTLRQTLLISRQFGKWQQRQDTPFSLSANKGEIQPLCLASPSAGNICLNGSWLAASSTWQVHGTAASLPLGLLKEAMKKPWPISGQLNGAIDLTGQQLKILTGKLHCDSTGMVVQIPLKNGATQTVEWKKNTLRADYANNQLQTVLDSELVDHSELHLDLRLANLQLPGTDLMRSPLKGTVQMHLRDLSPLAVLTEQMVNLSGSLQGQFMLNGTVASPIVTGQVELAKGRAEIPQLGITLSELTVNTKGENNRLQLLATAHSGSGYLHAESTLNLRQSDLSTYTISLTGEAFKAVHLPGLDLDVSPDIQLTVAKKRIDLHGTITIPKARITSIDFYNATARSGDMVVIDDEQEPLSPGSTFPLYSSVTVIAGDDVQIDAYGLRGTIAGKLQVIGQPDRQEVGNGTLSVKNGSFTLYGKRLKIDLGRLLFAGGPLTNPGIELRSENKTDKMTTGVIIHGFLQHPEMTFYSNPSMEQSAIISNLLKDTAIGGETRQDTGIIGKAATKTGLGGIVPYLQSVKKISMIDEIKLETGNNFDSVSLIFGSWLTPKFYVGYGKNLLKESGSFNTRYTLGKGFYFTTETGDSQSGGDLKYEFEN